MHRSFAKVLGVALGVVGVAVCSPAIAVPIEDPDPIIKNGGFEAGLSDWTVAGGAGVNTRPATNVINTNVGSTGFDSHFSSSFAVLGDNAGAIGGTPGSGIDSISQSFILPDTQGGQSVLSYELFIDFQSAFDGTDTSATLADVFDATLTLPSSAVVTIFSETSADPMTQRNNDPGFSGNPSFPVFVPCAGPSTCAGTYTLRFRLNEAGGGTNTAAGIDNVSITGDANVSPRVVPGATPLWAVGAGLLAIGFLRRHRRSPDRTAA